MALCYLCKTNEVSNINSHIIPSFLIAMVTSIDNSYRRNKELQFTINGNTTGIYMGRNVLEEEWNRCFDSLTDEELGKMRTSIDTRQRILCSVCEFNMGNYLESPYSNHLYTGANISSDTSYFFWVSVLWRISFFQSLGFRLPNNLEELLRKSLCRYLQYKSGISPMKKWRYPFIYRILYFKDFCKTHQSVIYGEYNEKLRIVSLIFGDIVVCFSFKNAPIPHNYKFYGLESSFISPQQNDGNQVEVLSPLNEDILLNAIDKLSYVIARVQLRGEREMVLKVWLALRNRTGFSLFNSAPCESFIRHILFNIHNERVKIGDQYSLKHFCNCYADGLRMFYGIKFDS